MLNLISKVLKSKTVIVNAVTVIAGLVSYAAGNEVIAEHPEAVSMLVAASGVLNVALRFLTSLPLSEKTSLLK